MHLIKYEPKQLVSDVSLSLYVTELHMTNHHHSVDHNGQGNHSKQYELTRIMGQFWSLLLLLCRYIFYVTLFINNSFNPSWVGILHLYPSGASYIDLRSPRFECNSCIIETLIVQNVRDLKGVPENKTPPQSLGF